MLIACVLLAGVTAGVTVGLHSSKDSDSARMEKNIDEIKVKIDYLDQCRKEITELLVYIGSLKEKCFQSQLEDFIELYFKLSGTNISNGVWKKLGIPIESDNIVVWADTVKSQNKRILKWNVWEIQRERVMLAVCGINTNRINRTVNWITYPLFNNERPNSSEVICNGSIGELVLAASGFPHSWEIETMYRNNLKDEVKKKELESQIDDACYSLEAFRDKLKEVSEIIEIGRKKLLVINDELEKVLNIRNETDYAYEMAAYLIKQGMDCFKIILDLVSIPFINEAGSISSELTNMINEDLRCSVFSKVDFSRFEVFYHNFVDIYPIDEEELSEFNIKIIDSKMYGDNVRYLYYYSNMGDKRWRDCCTDLSLCYDERFIYLSKESIDDLIKQLKRDLALGAKKTTVFYLGNKEIFERINDCIQKNYENVDVFYKGAGKYEDR